MKNKLVIIGKHYNVSLDIMEKVEGIIGFDAETFGELTPENVAKVTRDTLIELIEELHQSMPSSHFKDFKDKYEDDKLPNEDFN